MWVRVEIKGDLVSVVWSRMKQAPLATQSWSPLARVEFANSRLAIHRKRDPVFPTKLNRIERKANGARFVWTIADDGAYASVPKCLSNGGSQDARLFIVLHRREHRLEGWCIQGFIAGATLAAAILLVVLHMPAGVFLDVTTPGLLVAMAVGRVGCFFAGCCGGPPTASRWGVWSSDQRVGARRIPTQLLELMLALSLGLGVLVAVLGHGSAGGAFFVGGLAAYIPVP